MKIYWLILLLFIVFSFFTFSWLSTKDKKEVYIADIVKATMKNIVIIHYKKGISDWHAYIKEAQFSEDEKNAFINNIALFYPEKNLTLTSNHGVYSIKTGTITVDGKVTGKRKNTTFEASELYYNPIDDILTALKGIVIKGDQYIITGDEGKIQGVEFLEVTGNVKAIFY